MRPDDFTEDPSGIFAPLYKCAEHGDIWKIELFPVIDTDNDEAYNVPQCPKCQREVLPVIIEGKPAMHALTREEAFWENYNPEGISDDEDRED